MPTQNSDEPLMSRLFLPPINRAMRTLDPLFFQKTIPLTAAHVFDGRSIPRVKTECSKDLLLVPRLKYILTEKGADGQVKKLILLRPEVKHDDLSTAREATRELVNRRILELVPYTLHLKYENWNYGKRYFLEEIMNAILPEGLDDIPCAFTTAGHLAHLNLRENYLPYKHLIARVLLDKNPNISTVVNKVEDVGTGSVYRTFPMELLAGSPETEVSVRESGCVFKFDFAKVYWNSRLGREHGRIIDLFKPGDAVADVMAGVGPFAIPAAKKGVYVYANDLNPESYKSLKANIQANKVARYAFAHNQDGREFIRESIRALLDFSKSRAHANIAANQPKPKRKKENSAAPPLVMMAPAPPTFSHFVMNLPASATTFLDAFRGAYNGLESLFSGSRQLPMIHVYTFHKAPENEVAAVDICMDISKHLGCEVKPSDLDNLENVRLVSPNKTYYCVSFRLPPEVAFVGEEKR